MLRELSIKNFAIIDDLSISFERGLNILTGETGAGKSIIVNAVNLILGGRASAELIRTGEDSAELEAFFDVPEGNEAAKEASEQGLDLTDGFIIRRIIHKNGRHKTYVNGRLATAQTLARISSHLASVSGQHANQNLTKGDYHLLVLDQFGGTSGLREAVSMCYRDMLPMIKHLKALKSQQNEQADRMDLLAFQVREIEQAQISVGEDDELEDERRRLRHAEHIYETIGRCIEQLYRGEGAVVEQLSSVGKELQATGHIDSTLLPASERVAAASFDLEDVANELQAYLEKVVFDTDRLEVVEQRIDGLQRLKRKYGGSLDAVVAFGLNAQEELKRVSSIPEEIAAAEQTLAKSHRHLKGLCRKLSKKRQKEALHMAKSVAGELASLGMNKTRFSVAFKPVPLDRDVDPHLTVDESGIDPTGMDRVEFLISANVGEELRPVAQIASGGELSRIVLALKTLLATQDAVETVIFDEVDAGIGGGVAEKVGKKLDILARFQQVVCITHLPQIARFGTTHFKIEKRVHKKRTSASITPVSGEERVMELARMLGGTKTTKKALEHARELLETSLSKGK